MDYDIDFVDRTVKLALGNIHYKVHLGGGKNVIFLHGLGASTLTWKKLVNYISPGYNVYLLDLLGHGKSDKPEMDYTIGAQVLMLVQLIDELDIQKPYYLFGHSYGGWIAATYSSQFWVDGLILEDSAGLKESFDWIAEKGQVDDYKRRFFHEAMQLNDNKDYVIKSILTEDFARKEQLDEAVLSSITAPTLVIWGENDANIHKKYGEMFANRVKDGRLEMIKGAEHTPHYSNPGQVAALVDEFVAGEFKRYL